MSAGSFSKGVFGIHLRQSSPGRYIARLDAVEGANARGKVCSREFVVQGLTEVILPPTDR
jgi:hypothetical protein